MLMSYGADVVAKMTVVAGAVMAGDGAVATLGDDGTFTVVNSEVGSTVVVGEMVVGMTVVGQSVFDVPIESSEVR
jgi:hypothetical protein